MPRKTKTLDFNQEVARQVAAMTGQPIPTGLVAEVIARHNARKNPRKVVAGRSGGLKGGKARAASLSAKERSQIAKKGAETRWERERRIATMIARGQNSSQIEKKLGLPAGSLASVVRRIRAKTLRAKTENLVEAPS